MRFSIVSAFAFVAAVLAQDTCNANCFSESTSGTINYNAGSSQTLSWSNKAGNTVTIKLTYGPRNDLHPVATIADHIANTGSFVWNIDPNLPQRVDYALTITNDDDPSEINYTSQFDILNPNNIASNPPLTSTGSVTDSASATDAASTTGTDAATTTGTAIVTVTTSTASGSQASSTSAAAKTSATVSNAAPAVPTNNAAARPAIGAVSGLLAVAAGFAIAL